MSRAGSEPAATGVARALPALGYLLGLLCAVPLLVFALGVLALGHVIATRNVFTLLWHLAIAFAWGLPLGFLAVVALLVCAVFRWTRIAAAALLVVLNLAALVVVLRATGLPGGIGEAAFLGPTFVSLWLHGRILADARGVETDRLRVST
ncbi:MAG: hypothetical protein U0529_19155 [Thermoanaerobaculia bacterium]